MRPIIFSTLVQDELRDVVIGANGLFLDFFAAFVGPLERELNMRSTHRAGRAHGIADLARLHDAHQRHQLRAGER